MTLILVIIVFFSDQLTKIIITKNMLLHQTVAVIPGVLHLTLVHNRGAAFGILRDQVPLFIATSVIAIFLILLQLKREGIKFFSLYTVSLALVLAGAVGNLFDRVLFGYVIDFIDFRVWPVFNVADSAITVGAVLLGYSIFKPEKPKTKP